MSTLRVLALLLLVLGGCVILPTTRTTTRSAGTIEGRTLVGPDRDLVVSTKANGALLVIHALRLRECRREVLAVTELTKTKHLRKGGPDDPRGLVFGTLLAPLTIPVSFLVSGLIVVSSGEQVSQSYRVDHVVPFACNREAAGVEVKIGLPSGVTLTGHTSTHGNLVVRIPASEPYRGKATVAVSGATAAVEYSTPMPAVSVMRDAVRRCGALHDVTGMVRVQVSIDDAGAPSGLRADPGDSTFEACVSAAIGKLVFPVAQRGATIVLPFELAAAT